MALVKIAPVVTQPTPSKLSSKIYEELGDWFLANSDKLITSSDIARQLIHLRAKRKMATPNGITREYLHSVLTQTRHYLETPARRTSIVYIAGQGYRCGNADDLALFTARWIKRTLHSADRTTRLTEIVDKDRMPDALKKVFIEMHPRIKSIAKNGGKFIETFQEFVDKKRLESKRA